MKGILKVLVMKALEKNPDISGAKLSRIIEKKTERKPSPGTLYPLLKKLRKNNLLEEDDSGKENIYRLTKEGKKTLKKFEKKREEIMDRILTHMKEYHFLFGEEQINQFIEQMEMIKNWHREIPGYFVKMIEIKNILFGTENVTKEKKERIVDILEDTRKNIEDVIEDE